MEAFLLLNTCTCGLCLPKLNYQYVWSWCANSGLLSPRHVIAVVHFNLNLHRESRKKDSDGSKQVAVVYPKFKNGEATVRDVKIQANFSKCYKVTEINII